MQHFPPGGHQLGVHAVAPATIVPPFAHVPLPHTMQSPALEQQMVYGHGVAVHVLVAGDASTSPFVHPVGPVTRHDPS